MSCCEPVKLFPGLSHITASAVGTDVLCLLLPADHTVAGDPAEAFLARQSGRSAPGAGRRVQLNKCRPRAGQEIGGERDAGNLDRHRQAGRRPQEAARPERGSRVSCEVHGLWAD